MAFDKAGLLGRKSLKRKSIDLGDGSVWLREFSVGERRRLSEKHRTNDPDPVVAFRGNLALVAEALQNEDGTQMFGEAEIEGAVQALEDGSSETVFLLVQGVKELNGLGEGALKEALGKSGPTPTETSSSGSPETSTGSTQTL